MSLRSSVYRKLGLLEAFEPIERPQVENEKQPELKRPYIQQEKSSKFRPTKLEMIAHTKKLAGEVWHIAYCPRTETGWKGAPFWNLP